LPDEVGESLGLDKCELKGMSPNDVIALQKEITHQYQYELLMQLAKRNDLKSINDQKALNKLQRATDVKKAGESLTSKGMKSILSKDKKLLYAATSSKAVTSSTAAHDDSDDIDGPHDDTSSNTSDDVDYNAKKRNHLGGSLCEDTSGDTAIDFLDFFERDRKREKKERIKQANLEEELRQDRKEERRLQQEMIESLKALTRPNQPIT
jgi:hypothetical protein